MSAEGDSGPGRREFAYRLFAAEFDDASLSYSESDEERAPNYVVTPTGLRLNRLFAVGVATEVESINEETLRGRIVDPTGAFVTYAGQYQPEAQAFLDRTTPPAFVAITGKARTFEPEDSDRVFTSVRPESLSEVDADTRDRWAVSAAESTLERIAVCAAALDSSLRGDELRAALSEAGVDDSLAAGIPRAFDHYGTTTAYLEALRQLAVDALELVADEREEVRSLDLAPDEGGDAALGQLPAVDVDLDSAADAADAATTAEPAAEPEAESASAAESTDGTETTDKAEPPADSGGTADTAADESVDEPPAASETPTDEPTDPEPEPTDAPEPTGDAADGSTEPAESASTPDSAADTDGSSTADTDDASTADETGMYQLDEEEREELESEFDTGFSSGNEVDPAGEADIDVPDADELAERAEAEGDTSPASTDEGGLGDFDGGAGDFEDATDDPASDTEPVDDQPAASASDPDAQPTGESEPSDDQSTDEEPAADVDLENAVIETMAQLDDGNGVDRGALVEEVADAYGVGEAAIEAAIDDALMGGRCYEPADDTLKAI